MINTSNKICTHLHSVEDPCRQRHSRLQPRSRGLTAASAARGTRTERQRYPTDTRTLLACWNRYLPRWYASKREVSTCQLPVPGDGPEHPSNFMITCHLARLQVNNGWQHFTPLFRTKVLTIYRAVGMHACICMALAKSELCMSSRHASTGTRLPIPAAYEQFSCLLACIQNLIRTLKNQYADVAPATGAPRRAFAFLPLPRKGSKPILLLALVSEHTRFRLASLSGGVADVWYGWGS